MPAARAITHLLYLHGFRSSPQSAKARLMAQTIAAQFPMVHWWCPQLPPSPKNAIHLLMEGTHNWPRDSMAVVGSSLGGFYATVVAQGTGCAKSVVLNPAVEPARDLAKYIGEQASWHNPEERFFFRPEFVQELRALECGELDHPERFLSIIAKGDEVLDWQEMRARYANTRVMLLEGGDHAISDFGKHLPTILDFLELNCPGNPAEPR